MYLFWFYRFLSILNIQHLFNQIIIFLRNLSKYFNHKNFKSLQIQNIHLLFTIIYIFTLHYFLSKITLIIFLYQIFQKFFFIIIQSFVKYRIHIHNRSNDFFKAFSIYLRKRILSKKNHGYSWSIIDNQDWFYKRDEQFRW